VTADDTYQAGDVVTISLGQAYAGQFVSAWVHSVPTNLGGWMRTDAAGRVSATLPADLKQGTHRISVQDEGGNVIGWTTIKVEKAPKAPKPPKV